MGRVDVGDRVCMFANQDSGHRGIIAVGEATQRRQGPIIPMQLRPAWYGTEWQIPVKWLTPWNVANPCPYPALNATIYKCDPAQIAVIRSHFNI